MPKYKTVPKILDAAADRLEKHGWCQESFELGPKRCLVGALNEVSAGPSRKKAINFLRAVLMSSDEVDVISSNELLTDWNDRKSRRKSQVITALRKASKLAKRSKR